MASLLWPPTVNESAQRGQPRCVQLGPLCAGKSYKGYTFKYKETP